MSTHVLVQNYALSAAMGVPDSLLLILMRSESSSQYQYIIFAFAQKLLSEVLFFPKIP